MFYRWLMAIALALLPLTGAAGQLSFNPSAPEWGMDYLLPGGQYDPAVPAPADLLGFGVGRQAASPAEIQHCLENWAEAGDRARLFAYGSTYEGRPLHYMVVSSPRNLARLEEIQEGLARLADPRGLSAADGEALLDQLPAAAWMAYSIHGDEASGSDAALALLYHLLGSTSPQVAEMLEDLVVIVDPLMNPDGRQRYIHHTQEARGTQFNVDDQSLVHQGYWPSGRGNHYLFDMNRDWIFSRSQETRARIQALHRWSPHLFVDVHEMGSRDTYLLSPPREPRNPNVTQWRRQWGETFARRQGQAFDAHGWPYYMGEWNEAWYPGYSDAWAELQGAVGILLEQATIRENGVSRPQGTVETYGEAVRHHLVSSLSSLETLHQHAREVKRDFLAQRREAVAADGPYAGRTFVVLPTENQYRLRAFLDLVQLQGFEVYRAQEDIAAGSATDQLGRKRSSVTIPAGSLLIPNRQPQGHLLATALEFDPHMPREYLEKERRNLLRSGSSGLYDITAWNLTMLFGLEALTLPSDLPAQTVAVAAEDLAATPPAPAREGVVAWVFDGRDDRSVAAAGRLLQQGVQVRVADRDFTLEGQTFTPGSVVITRNDNRNIQGDLPAAVAAMSEELSLAAIGVSTGLGEGDLPDLGGGHFHLLKTPRIAIIGRSKVDSEDFGSIWYTLDHHLGFKHSHIDETSISFLDLRRYNVIILPSRFTGKLEGFPFSKLDGWIKDGGTLIASSWGAGVVARESSNLSQVRQLPDVLGDLDRYEMAVLREWVARHEPMPEDSVLWSHSVPSQSPHFPLQDLPGRPGSDELGKRDDWLSNFMPQGAILAGRVDPEHWLTFGSGDWLPVLFGNHPILMAAGRVEAPVRLGYIEADPASPANGGKLNRVGWAALPEGWDVHLRMSGLLWPEAAHRLTHAAYVTRERKWAGQIILFASPPAFRGATLATSRILSNAMVYGPGFGAHHPTPVLAR